MPSNICEPVTAMTSFIRHHSTGKQGMTGVTARRIHVNLFCLPFRSKFQLLGRIQTDSSEGLTHHIQMSFHLPPQIDFTRDITNWKLSNEVDICRNFLNYTVDVEKRKIVVTVSSFLGGCKR